MSRCEDAITSTFAFIVAVGIMLGSVAAVFGATNEIARSGVVQEAAQVNLQTEAISLKHILLDTPGVLDGGGEWDEAASKDADQLDRLGLAHPDGAGLQIEKLQNLRLAPRGVNDTDDFANYEEVAADLGLTGKGLDFHIRTKPSLRTVVDVLADPSLRDQNIKGLYIANVTGTYSGKSPDEDLTVDDFECTDSPTGSPSWRYSVNVTNGGSQSTQFFLVFKVTEGTTTLSRQDQSYMVGVGTTERIHVDMEAISGLGCSSTTQLVVEVLDPVQQLTTVSLSNPTIQGTVSSTAEDTFYTTLDVPWKDISGPQDDITLSYWGELIFDDDGDPIDTDTMTLEVRQGTDPAGALVYGPIVENVDSNPNKHDMVFDAVTDLGGAGEYTAYLTHDDSGIVATQRILVINGDPDAYVPSAASPTQTAYEEDPAVAEEVGFLNSLIEQFCPTYSDDKTNSSIGDRIDPAGNGKSVWNTDDWDARCGHFAVDTPLWDGELQPGGVVPDLQSELWALESRLLYSDGTPRYDLTNTIVVGSNVAHSSMTSANFGTPLKTWVLGGGTLIVFGSNGQSTQWMQDLFHAGSTSSSGGISAPDVSHPLISVPEPLAFDQYDTSQQGWDFTSSSDEYFTNVVNEGDTPVTAVSDPGDFGDGTIVLSSWRPYDLYGEGAGTSSDEGVRMVYNFIAQGYRDLFLDYGPPLPQGVPVIPAFGVSHVGHPDLGYVTMTVTIFVFPG